MSATASATWWPRRVARRLGVGAMLVRLQNYGRIGLPSLAQLAYARLRYLPRIDTIAPMPCGDGPEVHVLLHHQRVRDGAWALASFRHHAGRPCAIVVHDDGSLTSDDGALLRRLFPGVRVVSREEADDRVNAALAARGLHRCRAFRDGLVFGRKLIDPFFFLTHDRFVLIDSDVLFYRRPDEVLAAIDEGRARYSVDNGYRYSLPPGELQRLIGAPCIDAFNPGVVAARRDAGDLALVEEWLAHPGFWKDAAHPDYYAELTLWAMWLTRASAEPLSSAYAICPAPGDPGVVSGHYCGGGYWAALFYLRGVPHVLHQLEARA